MAPHLSFLLFIWIYPALLRVLVPPDPPEPVTFPPAATATLCLCSSHHNSICQDMVMGLQPVLETRGSERTRQVLLIHKYLTPKSAAS